MQRRQIDPPTLFDSQRYGFSQAVATTGGSLVHVSGQVGWDAEERLVGKDLTTQMAKALDNLEDVLAAAGGRIADVVALRIYIVQSAARDPVPRHATFAAFTTARTAVDCVLVLDAPPVRLRPASLPTTLLTRREHQQRHVTGHQLRLVMPCGGDSLPTRSRRPHGSSSAVSPVRDSSWRSRRRRSSSPPEPDAIRPTGRAARCRARAR